MIKCQICNREFKNYISLCLHVHQTHKISSNEYYNQYIKKYDEGICLECGKETNFINLNIGYREFCSNNCVNKSSIIKDKIRNLYLNKSDEERTLINNKIKRTNIKKYGVENQFQNKEIKNKIKQTFLGKYGVEHPLQNEEIKNKVKETYLKKFIPKVLELIELNNLELLSDYNQNRELIKLRCKKCNNEFETKYDYVQKGYGKCPICFPKVSGTSNLEIELSNFIKSIEQSEIIENDRTVLDGLELDICIPSKNIAIEFNGLYWHSEEQGKDKNYHLNKTEECLKNNIKLIHIFEDEWIYNQEIVKSRLKQIFGLNNNLPKIYARKCEIKEIDSKIKNKFLNNFHIQGGDKSNIKLGAFYNDELISVMTFSHGNISRKIMNNKLCWELSRFCSNSNYHIPGIASKLLSYFKRNYKWKEIYSYADRRWSHGNVYKKIGFELDSITKPNYWYIKNGIRIHRFNLRKKYNEPKDIPEWVLRQKEGYYRIWDCGHYKFRIEMRSNFL